MYRYKTFFFLTALIALTVGFMSSARADSCFVIQPYVLNATPDGAEIYWVSPSESQVATLYWAPVDVVDDNGNDATMDFSGNAQHAINSRSPEWEGETEAEVTYPPFHTPYTRSLNHQRQLVTLQDLQPRQMYRYRVECANGEQVNGRFRTAPEPGDTRPIRFSVMSDAHANSGRHGGVAHAVGELNDDFVMLTGDFSGGYGADWEHWLTYFEVARPYLKNHTLLPVVGNHDVSPARNYRSLFAFNDPDGEPEDEDEAGSWYSVRYGNLKMVVLDFHSSSRNLRPQLDWLKEELAGTDADWIVVGFHDSMFSVGGRVIMRTGIYHEFARAFEDYGVDVVFFGHDHIYERLLPIGSDDNKPVHYVSINSGGGYRAVRPSPIVTGGIGRRATMYAHVTIEDNRLEMEARLSNGSVIDRLELIKESPDRYQDDVMERAVALDLALDLAYFWSRDYSDRHMRRDLEGELTRLSGDGSTAEIKMSLPVVIPDARLVVHPMEDANSWQTGEQFVDISGNRVTVELKVPPNVQNVAGNLVPAVILPVNLEIDDRSFESAEIRPRIMLPSMDRPVLIHPRHTVSTTTRPEYSWHSVPGGFRYQLQVAVSNFSSSDDIRLDTEVEDTLFVHPGEIELKPENLYYWRLRALQTGEELFSDGSWSNTGIFQTSRETSAVEDAERPLTTELLQNYPNPFNAVTVIGYQLAAEGDVRLDVYDVLGRRVAELVEGRLPGGRHEVRFDAGSMPGGVYLYRLRAGGEVITRHMLLVK